MNFSFNRLFATLFALLLTLATAESALAAFAANTQITSQATLTYSDGATTRTASATVTVKVALVPSAPTIVGPSTQSATYNGSSTAINSTFTLIATSNGPETFDLSGAVTAFNNTTGATASTPASVTLGATIVLPGSTASSIVVPSDGDLPGGPAGVNEIEIGDRVVINGELRTVTNLVNNNNGTWSIILDSALANVPASGMLVAEQKTVTLTVTAGEIEIQGNDIVVSANLAAVSTATGNSHGAAAPTVFTFTSGVANIFKYVRNMTGAVAGNLPYTYNGQTYYATDVTGQPGDLLEYLLVAQNTGGAAITQAVITDLLPTGFVTLKDNAYGAGREIAYVSETASVSTLSKALDADQGHYDSATNTLTVHVGNGATNDTGGAIPGGNSSVLVLYQVTINP